MAFALCFKSSSSSFLMEVSRRRSVSTWSRRSSRLLTLCLSVWTSSSRACSTASRTASRVGRCRRICMRLWDTIQLLQLLLQLRLQQGLLLHFGLQSLLDGGAAHCVLLLQGPDRREDHFPQLVPSRLEALGLFQELLRAAPPHVWKRPTPVEFCVSGVILQNLGAVSLHRSGLQSNTGCGVVVLDLQAALVHLQAPRLVL
mmetsp:Transcript_132360/g.229522  ORF Transcript_132360/g.229522 Transcript_132360/m.229522 type:complete len:201 (+) Transcript_132360:230-832(+)